MSWGLHTFMFQRVYKNPLAKAEEAKAKILIEELYRYFRADPARLPTLYQEIARKYDTDRAVCDYISGMSDNYAVELYSELFIPKSWR